MKKIAIFISGRGSNMKAVVEQCQAGVLKDLAEVVLVFANKPAAAGLEYAKSQGLEVQSIASKGKKRVDFDLSVLELLKNYAVDYIVLAGYMRVLSPAFIQAYPNKIINIHPADTQQHQGLHAYEWAFEQQLSSTKITVHYVDEGMDTGSIIEQATVNLEGADTLEEVERRGLSVEHQFYSDVIRKLLLNETN
jgi:phosphoribosylglycinamide formyltransferase 1